MLPCCHAAMLPREWRIPSKMAALSCRHGAFVEASALHHLCCSARNVNPPLSESVTHLFPYCRLVHLDPLLLITSDHPSILISFTL